MRDKRFVAVHRGGLLTQDQHRKLMHWASACAQHALPLLEGDMDLRLVDALQVAHQWEQGNVKTGDAMKAAVGAHAAAREASNPVAMALARSIGHTVATAHMADHALGSALYALKAMQLAGKAVADEREWQNNQLQELLPEMVAVINTTMQQKEKLLVGSPGFG